MPLPHPHGAFWGTGWEHSGSVEAGGQQTVSGTPAVRSVGEAAAASHQNAHTFHAFWAVILVTTISEERYNLQGPQDSDLGDRRSASLPRIPCTCTCAYFLASLQVGGGVAPPLV